MMRSSDSKISVDIDDINIYETITTKRKRSIEREKKMMHERKPSSSSTEKSSVNMPISSLSNAMNIAVKLRESSVQRRLRRNGGNKDELHSSSGNWSASSESGRTSIASEITAHPKSTTSTATSSNSLNQHAPSSVNSRRRFNFNTSASGSVTSEGTLTPDIIHDLHEDGDSVYSCDTEGYYTSFHMDSGLKTLKEEDTPPTPLHSTSTFTNENSAENEYELFGKGSTSTTTSSAGTVCTTLLAAESNRSLVVGPAVPERKSSLSKVSNKEKSPESSLEREYGSSDKTGTVKRSPLGNKATVIAVVHKQVDGDVSPDSGHNTSSSPIESINSPNGHRSGSEFEFSESSDMEGPDRIERIRVKTTINSSRIPSMCAITPPQSDDESVKSHNFESEQQINDLNNGNKPQYKLKPGEKDLDILKFADGKTTVQVINVNPQTGYATIETVKKESNIQIDKKLINHTDKTDEGKEVLAQTNKSMRSASPSGGSVVVKEEPQRSLYSQPIFKATLMPLNNMLGKIKMNISNFTQRRDSKSPVKPTQELCDDAGEYVTIADVRNNNEKAYTYEASKDEVDEKLSPKKSNTSVISNNLNEGSGIVEKLNTSDEINKNLNTILSGKIKETEYVSLNELPLCESEQNVNLDSLERRRRQGARVTLNAEGKVVYTSDSLKRRRGSHTTFEPGPCVRKSTPNQSPLLHRTPKAIRPVIGQDLNRKTYMENSRPLSPQLGKVVIRASSGMSNSTSEVIRMPPNKIVTPTVRPMSPKANNSGSLTRGAYVHMQETRTSLSPVTSEEGKTENPLASNFSAKFVRSNSLPRVRIKRQNVSSKNLVSNVPSLNRKMNYNRSHESPQCKLNNLIIPGDSTVKRNKSKVNLDGKVVTLNDSNFVQNDAKRLGGEKTKVGDVNIMQIDKKVEIENNLKLRENNIELGGIGMQPGEKTVNTHYTVIKAEKIDAIDGSTYQTKNILKEKETAGKFEIMKQRTEKEIIENKIQSEQSENDTDTKEIKLPIRENKLAANKPKLDEEITFDKSKTASNNSNHCMQENNVKHNDTRTIQNGKKLYQVNNATKDKYELLNNANVTTNSRKIKRSESYRIANSLLSPTKKILNIEKNKGDIEDEVEKEIAAELWRERINYPPTVSPKLCEKNCHIYSKSHAQQLLLASPNRITIPKDSSEHKARILNVSIVDTEIW